MHTKTYTQRPTYMHRGTYTHTYTENAVKYTLYHTHIHTHTHRHTQVLLTHNSWTITLPCESLKGHTLDIHCCTGPPRSFLFLVPAPLPYKKPRVSSAIPALWPTHSCQSTGTARYGWPSPWHVTLACAGWFSQSLTRSGEPDYPRWAASDIDLCWLWSIPLWFQKSVTFQYMTGED